MLRSRILLGLIALGAAGGLTLLVLDATVFAPLDGAAAPTPSVESPDFATDAAAPPASESADGTHRLFRIDPSQSEVRYEVGETFFSENNRFAIAVGRTRGVSGEVLVDLDQPAASEVGEIVIDVSQFTSDESRRDNYIRRSGLESARYPVARFVARAVEGLPTAAIEPGVEVAFTIRGELTVKEVTRSVEWQATARLEGDRLIGRAETEILMSDFGVGPIRIPFLATEDLVRLVFEFVALLESSAIRLQATV